MLLICLLMSANMVWAEKQFFCSEGTRIHYRDMGQGTPVVLLHGYNMDGSMWDHTDLVKTLAPNHRIISIDFRGHGSSGKPSEPSQYGPQVGKDVINLLDHLKISQAHMVGFSMGSYVLGRLLVTDPDRIRTATMASGYFPFSSQEEIMYAEETAQHMEESAAQHKGEEQAHYLAMAAVARAWQRDAVSDAQLASIKVPFQVVFGSREQDDMFKSQQHRFTLSTSAQPLIIIEGADHDSEQAAVLRPEFTAAVQRMLVLK